MKKLAAASLIGLFLLTGCTNNSNESPPVSLEGKDFSNPSVTPSPSAAFKESDNTVFVNNVFNKVLVEALNVDYAQKVNQSYVSLTTFDVFEDARDANNKLYQDSTKALYDSDKIKMVTSFLHIDKINEQMIAMTFKPETATEVGTGQITYTLANLGLSNLLYSTYDLAKVSNYKNISFTVPDNAIEVKDDVMTVNMSLVKVLSDKKDITKAVIKDNPINLEFIKVNDEWKINTNKGIDILVKEIEQNIENLKKSKK